MDGTSSGGRNKTSDGNGVSGAFFGVGGYILLLMCFSASQEAVKDKSCNTPEEDSQA